MDRLEKDNFMITAIDIGITYSSYAYSFRHDFMKDPLKIEIPTFAGPTIFWKIPTTALFDPDGTFQAFGYEAEEKYTELKEKSEHHGWYYFKKIQISPFSKKSRMVLKDITNKEMDALEVLSKAIGYMKNHLQKTLKQTNANVHSSEIHWVLNIPAMLNNHAKELCREAAEKAGINHDDLSLALQAEAALLYCMNIPEDIAGSVRAADEEQIFKSFLPGKKYLVLNCQEEILDTTLLQVQQDKTLREIDNSKTGPCGSNMVNEELKKLLVKIVGSYTMDQFQTNAIHEFVNLFREFENKQQTFKFETDAKCSLKLPVTLLEMFIDNYEEDINTVIEQTELADKVHMLADKLRIDPKVVKTMFKAPTEHILSQVNDLLKRRLYKDLDMIVVVGEFSTSAIVQQIIRSAMKEKGVKTTFPPEPYLAVLKGAVIFGHSNIQAKSRSATHRYDIAPGLLEKCRKINPQNPLKRPSIKADNPHCDEGYFSIESQQKNVILKTNITKCKRQKYITDESRIELDVFNQYGWKEQNVFCKMSLTRRKLQVEMNINTLKIEDKVIFTSEQCERAGAAQNVTTFSEIMSQLLDQLELIVYGDTHLNENRALQNLLILMGIESGAKADPLRVKRYVYGLNNYDEPLIAAVAIGLKLYEVVFTIFAKNDVNTFDIQKLVGYAPSKEQQQNLRKELEAWSKANVETQADEQKMTQDLGASLHTEAQILSFQDDWDDCLNTAHGRAQWKCINCDDYFCTTCKAAHMRGKKGRRHVLLHISDREKEETIRKEVFCRIHESKELDMYCITDKQAICAICSVSETHAHHQTDPLDKYADRLRSSVGSALNKADKDFPQYDAIIDYLSENLSVALRTSQANCQLIDTAFKKAVTKLKRNAESLKAKERSKLEIIKKSVQEEIGNLKRQRNQTKSKIFDSRKFLENCNEKELIRQADTYAAKLDMIRMPKRTENVSIHKMTLTEIHGKLGEYLFSE